MKRFLICLLALAGLAAPGARAQPMPAQYEQWVPTGSLVASSASTNWTVPNLENGQLLTVQAVTSNSASVAVYHLAAYGSGKYLTNTVLPALTDRVLYNVPSAALGTNEWDNARPVWLIPGDSLRFVCTPTNSSATVVIRTGVR